ncbi:uncharacterized protein LOC121858032 isoform X2 [Homarus americanus]|uniref:uncharacterized protein LOC121858032 isoform X2 n=1 Tax=Homarus americanus TaxID=6706 RepID=UPI001C47EAC4|nr:uncharacterized protein LOC121858032 isoform X2 [Homarus americanus]
MATNISRERRNTLPIIHTRGTYYQVGYDVINFPHYIRELQGTADGARLPFYDLMVLHMPQRNRASGLIDLGRGDQDYPPSPPAGGVDFGCSSVSLNLEDEVLLGHTEDASGELLNHSYIVSAQVREEEGQGRWGTREEHFTAFCYAGHLPGYCMGFNHHGIVYSVNVLIPQHIFSGKTPRHFLCRALLSAENMAALHTILKDEGVGAADGFSVNVAMMSEDGSHTFHNLEVGTTGRGDRCSQFSVQVLNTGDHLLHTNTYLHLDIPEQEGSLVLESSKQRHARERECPAPRTQQLLIDLLSDTHDPTHPIFRTSDKSFMTIALGLFDLLKKTWTIWIKNPKLNDPLFSLPLTFKWDP